MAIFEYNCYECNLEESIVKPAKDGPKEEFCPKCGKPMKKNWGAPKVHTHFPDSPAFDYTKRPSGRQKQYWSTSEL